MDDILFVHISFILLNYEQNKDAIAFQAGWCIAARYVAEFGMLHQFSFCLSSIILFHIDFTYG